MGGGLSALAASSELTVRRFLFLFAHMQPNFQTLILSHHKACYCGWTQFTQKDLQCQSNTPGHQEVAAEGHHHKLGIQVVLN